MNSTVTVSFLFLIFIKSFTNQQHKLLRYLQSLNNIKSPGTLAMNMSIVSTNGFWNLNLQDDGNLVLKDPNGIPMWASGSNGKGTSPFTLKVQEDGNLVLIDSKNASIWTSNTAGKGKAPFSLVVNADGNSILYDSTGVPTWASNTNFAPVFPSGGCVWLFSECNFKGTKKEYCGDFKTLDSTTSSILMPEPTVNCSSNNCASLVGNQKFTIFRPFDNIQNSKLSADFDAFGMDFYVGLFASDQSTSFLYSIIYGGWGNSQTRVFKSGFDTEAVCNYQLGVNNTNEKTSYQLFVDKLAGTISMKSNGVEAFNCKITNMNGSDIKYYGFGSYSVGSKVCLGNGSSSNCINTSSFPVKVFSLQNFSGAELTISNPNVCLKNVNFDNKIASIMFPSKNCNSNQYLSNGQCLDRPSKCTKCEGPNKCTACESSLTVNSSTGLCSISCPSGQYENNGTCANCSTNCVTCSSYNKCTSCKGSLRINSLQMCEPDCPPSQYVLKESCMDCPSTCLTCLNDKMCLSCYGNAVLSPTYKFDLTCTNNEFRASTGECSKCPVTCEKCLDWNTCVSCINGFILYQGKCLSECPSGTLKNKGNCYAIVQCTAGWFQDFNNSGECSKCGDNCLKCVSQTSCIQCDGNFNLLGFDSTNKKYYEVSAESGAGLDGPSVSFGIKYGQESETSIKIGSSSCTTPDQMLLVQGFQPKSNTGMTVGIVIGVVGFVAITKFLFIAYKKKWLCWGSNADSSVDQETKNAGKDVDYAPPGEASAKAL